MADKIGIDDVVEQAAAGVLRALEARTAGRTASSADYVKSGFNVQFIIRAGGIPADPWDYRNQGPNPVLTADQGKPKK
jgi:hypothetical protein